MGTGAVRTPEILPGTRSTLLAALESIPMVLCGAHLRQDERQADLSGRDRRGRLRQLAGRSPGGIRRQRRQSGLRAAPGRPGSPPSQPDCPFPGLLAFDERYAAVYFGRKPEIQTVLEQLNEMHRKGEPRLLMIVGGSGSGKSSLLKAGLRTVGRMP